MDLLDRVVSRENGVSTSTWTRLLVTGDLKDSDITPSGQRVMFAYGLDDQFTYHGIKQTASVSLNFFSGLSK